MDISGPTWITPDAASVADALAAAGIAADPSRLELLERDDRFAAILPDGLIAWFPSNHKGQQRLNRETRVLRLLEQHCSFDVPTIVREGSGWQLRRLVEGRTEPWMAYQQVQSDKDYASALGASLGRVLADQHLNVPLAELADWLPRAPSWPVSYAEIARDLPRVIDDEPLINRALAHIERHEAEAWWAFSTMTAQPCSTATTTSPTSSSTTTTTPCSKALSTPTSRPVANR